MSTDEIVGALTEKRRDDVRWQEGRTFGMVYDAGPETHDVIAATALMFLHDNALNTQAFPSLGEIQSEVVGVTADLLHGGPEAGRVPHLGWYRVDPHGGARGDRAGPGRARRHRARDRAADERARRVPQGCALLRCEASARCRSTPTGVPTWTPPPTSSRPNTVLVVGSAPQYPQGVIDPIPDLAALAQSRRRELPHRRVHGRLRAAVHGAARDGRPALGLPCGGRHHHLGRRPQVRLRAEGCVGDPASHQGAPPLPDLRVRGLARRLLRVAEHAGHPRRAADGDGVGDAAPPRAGRLPPPDRRRRSRPPTAWMRASARSTGSRCSATRTRSCWRSWPTGPPNGPWTRSRSATRMRRGWFHDRQKPPDALHSTVSAGNAPVIEEYLVDLAASASTRSPAARAGDRCTNVLHAGVTAVSPPSSAGAPRRNST